MTVPQPLGEGVGQARGADGRLRARDVVVRALPRRRGRLDVQKQPGRPRVAVAGLADAAGIQEEAGAAQVGPLARVALGARSVAGDPNTEVVDKGPLTQTILAAPTGDAPQASVQTP